MRSFIVIPIYIVVVLLVATCSATWSDDDGVSSSSSTRTPSRTPYSRSSTPTPTQTPILACTANPHKFSLVQKFAPTVPYDCTNCVFGAPAAVIGSNTIVIGNSRLDTDGAALVYVDFTRNMFSDTFTGPEDIEETPNTIAIAIEGSQTHLYVVESNVLSGERYLIQYPAQTPGWNDGTVLYHPSCTNGTYGASAEPYHHNKGLAHSDTVMLCKCIRAGTGIDIVWAIWIDPTGLGLGWTPLGYIDVPNTEGTLTNSYYSSAFVRNDGALIVIGTPATGEVHFYKINAAATAHELIGTRTRFGSSRLGISVTCRSNWNDMVQPAYRDVCVVCDGKIDVWWSTGCYVYTNVRSNPTWTNSVPSPMISGWTRGFGRTSIAFVETTDKCLLAIGTRGTVQTGYTDYMGGSDAGFVTVYSFTGPDVLTEVYTHQINEENPYGNILVAIALEAPVYGTVAYLYVSTTNVDYTQNQFQYGYLFCLEDKKGCGRCGCKGDSLAFPDMVYDNVCVGGSTVVGPKVNYDPYFTESCRATSASNASYEYGVSFPWGGTCNSTCGGAPVNGTCTMGVCGPVASCSSTPSATSTRTPSSTSSITRTPTGTPTPSMTGTGTQTSSVTATKTGTPTNTGTGTRTPSVTPTRTATATPTPTRTATKTPSATPTTSPTLTASPTQTPTGTPTQTATKTPTMTSVETQTATPTPTTTTSVSGTPTSTGTDTPTPSATATTTTTESATPTATTTGTATATVTPSPTGSDTPTSTSTGTPTASPTPSTSLSSTQTQTPSISDSGTPTPTQTPSGTPTQTPSTSMSNTPTNTATQTQTPTSSPSETPTPSISDSATPTPSQTPTPSPSLSTTQTESQTPTPTGSPTTTPTPSTTISPGASESSTPTVSDSATPTPSETPTPSPSMSTTQTESQTPTPTQTPSQTGTTTVTATPTPTPTVSESATQTPTNTPTPSTSMSSTQSESQTPTVTPSTTSTVTESVTPTPTATSTVTPTGSDSSTPTPTASFSNTPTGTVSATTTSTPTATMTPTPSTSLSSTATESVTPTPTPSPTATATPTTTPASQTPTISPTASDTVTPTSTASATSTTTITASPTVSPTRTQTGTPGPTSTATPCPSPPECWTYDSSYPGACDTLAPLPIGEECGGYDHYCDGLGNCATQLCYTNDSCVGLTCQQRRADVYANASRYVYAMEHCMNLYGGVPIQNANVSGIGEAPVEEWVKYATVLIHRIGVCTNITSCAQFYQDFALINASIAIMSGVGASLEMYDPTVSCTPATMDVALAECWPPDDSWWGMALFEDMKYISDIDINDYVGKQRICVAIRSNGTVHGALVESVPLAYGSFIHSQNITLTSNTLFTDGQYAAVTRLYHGSRLPTNETYVSDAGQNATLILRVRQMFEPLPLYYTDHHSEMFVNTHQFQTLDVCPAYFTRTIVTPSNRFGEYPAAPAVQFPPLQIEFGTGIHVHTIRQWDLFSVMYSGAVYNYYEQSVAMTIMVQTACMPWAEERSLFIDAFPHFRPLFELDHLLADDDDCDGDALCPTWYEHPNNAYIYPSAFNIDLYNICFV